jgi:predicted acylesterase/phospholipase RssA
MIKAVCILVSLSCTVYLLNAYDAAPMRKPDLVLSSGFLAFARHAGVIKAMENANVEVANIVGTSSGSLAGAFYAAGYNADRISDELSKQKPIELIRPGKRINRGAFSLRALERHLATLLPKDFKDLEKPLAVGVYETDAADRKFELITDGDLPAAVAASCAIPYVFQPIKTGNPPRYLADGGFADRFGLDEWYTWAESLDKAIGAERRAIVHAVGTSRKKKDPYG